MPVFVQHHLGMRKLAVLSSAAIIGVSGLAIAPSAQATTDPQPQIASAASPVPGRFCKKAERGKVKKTAKYGKVKCKAEGRYSRWKRI